MNEASYIDKREVPRWNLKVPLQVGMDGSEMAIGDAVDISIKGVRILAEQPLALNQRMGMWIQLPTGDSWKKAALLLEGVWGHQHGDGLFETGCKFLDIDVEALMTIQGLIDEQSSFG